MGPVGPVCVLLASAGRAAEILAQQAFQGEARRTELGRVPLWLLAGFVKRNLGGVDLVIVQLDTLAAKLFRPNDCLCVPESLDVGLRVPDEIPSLLKSNHSLKDDMRIVRKNGLTMRISHDESDFEGFYEDSYVPFVNGRHGQDSVPRDKEWLRRQFREGAILWVMRGDQRLGGAVVSSGHGALHFWALATQDGDVRHMKEGAIAALYLFVVEHAKAEGCSYVDFGRSRGFLGDNILRYKRKWGMELRAQGDLQSFLFVSWPQWNSTVAAFLASASVVHQDGADLAVVTATGLDVKAGQEDAERVLHRVAMDGLARIVMVNESGWGEGVVVPPRVRLAGAKPKAGELALLAQARG